MGCENRRSLALALALALVGVLLFALLVWGWVK
jgi:hypothetical protein